MIKRFAWKVALGCFLQLSLLAVSAPAFETARVLDGGRREVKLDQGFASGLETGDLLIVQRAGKKVGVVRVQQIRENDSRAEALSLEEGEKFREGDLAAYGLLPYVPSAESSGDEEGEDQRLLFSSRQMTGTDEAFLNELGRQIADAERRLGMPLDLPQDLYASSAQSAFTDGALPPDPILDFPAGSVRPMAARTRDAAPDAMEAGVEMDMEAPEFAGASAPAQVAPSDWTVGGAPDPAFASRRAGEAVLEMSDAGAGAAASFIKQKKLALEKNPSDRQAMLDLAAAYMEKGDYTHAIGWYKAAVEADPKAAENDRIVFQIVKANYLNGDKATALAYFNYLKEHYPQSVYARGAGQTVEEGASVRPPSFDSKSQTEGTAPSDDSFQRRRKPKKLSGLPPGDEPAKEIVKVASTAPFFYGAVFFSPISGEISYSTTEIGLNSASGKTPAAQHRPREKRFPRRSGPKALSLPAEEPEEAGLPKTEMKVRRLEPAEPEASSLDEEEEASAGKPLMKEEAAPVEKETQSDSPANASPSPPVRAAPPGRSVKTAGLVALHYLSLGDGPFPLPRSSVLDRGDLGFIGPDSHLDFTSEGEKTTSFLSVGFTDSEGEFQIMEAYALKRLNGGAELRVGKAPLPFGSDRRLIQIDYPNLAYFSDFYKARGIGVFYRGKEGGSRVRIHAAATAAREYDAMVDGTTGGAIDYFPAFGPGDGVDVAIKFETGGWREGSAKYGVSLAKRNLNAPGDSSRGSLKAAAFESSRTAKGIASVVEWVWMEAEKREFARSNPGAFGPRESERSLLTRLSLNVPLRSWKGHADFRRLDLEGGVEFWQYNLGASRALDRGLECRIDWKRLQLDGAGRQDALEATAYVEI